MTIKSVQKVIKVGSSLAVTIPARDAKAAGLVVGSEVRSAVSPVGAADDVMADFEQLTAEYEAFKRQYAQTLKNLSQR